MKGAEGGDQGGARGGDKRGVSGDTAVSVSKCATSVAQHNQAL